MDKNNKLSDDNLKKVSGGNEKQMMELAAALGVSYSAFKSGDNRIVRKLNEEYDVIADVLSCGTKKNKYHDKITGKTISHAEVLRRIKEG